MGEAKQKAAAIAKWRDGLSDEAKIVNDAAQALFDKFIKPRHVTGMCYHSVFFLHEFLKDRHGIITVPIVGYVNDGTDDIMISHAWLEYEGKKTDVSLAVTARPDVSPAGELIILDRVVKGGHKYFYHREMTTAGLLQLQKMRMNGQQALVDHKMEEHSLMTARSTQTELIRSYLDGEPNGLTYEKIVVLIES
ncbi:hypothetical protein EOA33_29175 [Mesorhizobium sp. M4A.F.Ca.ET.050.02.1.1]|uniref:hypothetical protein n=1 Tax=Mesorhizobium sp. M4A.F.Ca.ET.050.02.1.1 TaxID=2496754 RepID=UPI000FCAB205|nr:hypothetical protein [Mesorhizobium sp. M4A.F.Ca.ET.050.02.1.1]RUX43488.1 hypothetical protein EOA33_29175 [Mesorhizobium sp. M4A.F.Ca.ET.050.02.1.1]